jgi:hypothetical protein
MRRAARYLAISSKKSMCALKKNDSAGRRVDRQAGLQRELDVGEPVRERERQFLRRREPASRMW